MLPLPDHGRPCPATQCPLHVVQKERDGTEGWIAEQPAVLSDVLDVLCGVTGERDGDDTVRESLADAVFLLVRVGKTVRIASAHQTVVA